MFGFCMVRALKTQVDLAQHPRTVQTKIRFVFSNKIIQSSLQYHVAIFILVVSLFFLKVMCNNQQRFPSLSSASLHVFKFGEANFQVNCHFLILLTGNGASDPWPKPNFDKPFSVYRWSLKRVYFQNYTLLSLAGAYIAVHIHNVMHKKHLNSSAASRNEIQKSQVEISYLKKSP